MLVSHTALCHSGAESFENVLAFKADIWRADTGRHKRCNTVCVGHLLLLLSLTFAIWRPQQISGHCWATIHQYKHIHRKYLCVLLIRLRGLQGSL